jgi:hypothetical protein
MSWSLRLTNGDLNLDGGDYAVVTGPEKLVQDLRCWILEPQGNDVMHPTYGSIMEDVIGQYLSPEQMMNIEAEIRRVVMSYSAQQQDRRSRDAVVYGGKNTLSPGEICTGISKIVIQPVSDAAVCWVSITTANGDALAFTV